jgi:ribonucleoside-triphosphate reductase
MFTQGGAYGGNLNPEDEIKSLLKSATISFGITSLHELQILHNSKSISEDNSFAMDTMKYINEYVDRVKEEDGILYAIYGSPAESLCGTQVNQFRNKYGVIENVSDKGFFTNSFHCYVGDDISPFEKQDKEKELFDLLKGGHIQYVRVNPENKVALKKLILRGLKNGFYQGVNFNECTCEDCGNEWSGQHGENCPKCDSSNITETNRNCGYKGNSRVKGDRTFNDAKIEEIKHRVSM